MIIEGGVYYQRRGILGYFAAPNHSGANAPKRPIAVRSAALVMERWPSKLVSKSR